MSMVIGTALITQMGCRTHLEAVKTVSDTTKVQITYKDTIIPLKPYTAVLDGVTVSVDTNKQAQLEPIEIVKDKVHIKTRIKNNKLTVEVTKEPDSISIKIPQTTITKEHKEFTKETKVIETKRTPSWVTTGAIIGYAMVILSFLVLLAWLRKKFLP